MTWHTLLQQVNSHFCIEICWIALKIGIEFSHQTAAFKQIKSVHFLVIAHTVFFSTNVKKNRMTAMFVLSIVNLDCTVCKACVIVSSFGKEFYSRATTKNTNFYFSQIYVTIFIKRVNRLAFLKRVNHFDKMICDKYYYCNF